MDKNNKANRDKTGQWLSLKEKFRDLNSEVLLIEPQKDLPDMVYVDVGILFRDIYIPSNFRYEQRQGERKHFIK